MPAAQPELELGSSSSCSVTGNREIDTHSLVRKIGNRDSSALGRAVSILENSTSLKSKILKHFKSLPAHGFSIGVTGSPGAGKSTLITALAKLMRSRKKKVAIVAVDPTSPKTGGAFLGDRIRMQMLSEDEGVFIRSMASRGAQGGIAKATKDVAYLLSKAGYDFVFIETVGAGQLDYEVTKIADLTLLVVTPEAGDEMQFMKAGLRELADAFVINKADRPGAQAMEDFLKQSGMGVPIFKTIAEQQRGIEPLYEFIQTQRYH